MKQAKPSEVLTVTLLQRHVEALRDLAYTVSLAAEPGSNTDHAAGELYHSLCTWLGSRMPR